LTQVCPGEHDVPQFPQFVLLEARSTQTPAQSVVPCGQAQLPIEHTRFPAQFSPQKPQLLLSFSRSTHALPHFASPEPQFVEHVPALQTRPIMQRLPHVPQSCPLVCRFTHISAIMNMTVHAVSPAGHTHVPPWHAPPNGHPLPHAPQFALLVFRFTQVMPIIPNPPGHDVSPVGQPAWQVPFTHMLPMPQWTPHAPQLRGSLLVSVHWPMHVVSAALHVHIPFTHEAPVPQIVPQVPQSKGSVVRSTQALLQSVSPFPQINAQMPEEQTHPAPHAIPQPPQFLGSLCVSVQTPLHRRPLL
jgi:hypothetical protein